MTIREFKIDNNKEYSPQESKKIFETHQKIILLGNYCQVTWESPKKTYSSTDWKLNLQNDDEIEIFHTNIQIQETILKNQNIQNIDLQFEQIYDSFFDMPNRDFLDLSVYNSFSLVWRLVDMRDYAIRLGKCFFEEQTKYDPLLKDLENGLINEYDYDCIWLESESIKVFFYLLGNYYQEIKEILLKNCDEYPFESMIDLFCKTIKERFNQLFSLYLKEKHVVNQNKLRQIALASMKDYQGKLTEEELKELERLSKKHTVSSPWETRVIEAVETLYKQGLVEIGSYIKQDQDINYKLNTKQYKSSFNGENPPSETWKKGFYSPGIEPGWKS